MTTSEEWLERLGLAEPTTDMYALPSSVRLLRRNERGQVVAQNWPKPQASNPNFLTEELASFDRERQK